MLVYAWAEGELLHHNALDRFRALPVHEILPCSMPWYALHARLAQAGWVAVDFYDGCLIYDFRRQDLTVVDLDTYHRGPLTNEMGRMFGPTRFMAPEEFELGATIDERTTVFTMGRTAAVLLSDGSLDHGPFRGSEAQWEVMLTACSAGPNDRFATVAALNAAWQGQRV